MVNSRLGFSAARVLIATILIIIIIAGFGAFRYFRYQAALEDNPSARPEPLMPQIIKPAPQVLSDEVVTVEASDAWGFEFTLNRSAPVRVEVEGVKHTDKGFSLHLMTADQWPAFGSGKEFKHLAGFHGDRVTKATKQDQLPAGGYVVALRNSENFMNAMQVRVKVIANPD